MMLSDLGQLMICRRQVSEHAARVSWQQPADIGTGAEIEENLVEYWAAGSWDTKRIVVRNAQDCLLTDLAMNTTYSVKVMVRMTDIYFFKPRGEHFPAGHHIQEQE